MEYKELDDKTLKKLHVVEIDILKEIDRICKKYNIKYFLCGGSLLGSIRHEGFIPWDDDIDIGMIREDYEKFKTAFIKEKESEYFLHTYDSDKNYWLPFMKVRKNNTTVDEQFISHLNTHKGIFVDIFPFDKVPDNGFSKSLKFRAFLIKLIVEAIFVKQGVYSCKDSRRPLFTKIMTIFKVSTLFKMQNKLMMAYEKKDVNHLICYVGTYNTEKEYIKKSDIFPLREEGLFEGQKYPIPNNYDVYLKNLYNDYMKLPPKEKRRNHNPVAIDFNKGENRTNGD